MKSIIKKHQPKSAERLGSSPAENGSEHSLDALRQRVERAEACVRSLDAENKQLRAERTRAVLAAARVTTDSDNAYSPEADGRKQRFETLTEELEIAKAAHSEAARDREVAIKALKRALQDDYSRQLAALQENHAAELAIVSLKAEEQARAAVANRLDGLESEVGEAKQALRAAKQQHEMNLWNLEEALERKFAAEMDALNRRHAAALEELPRREKQQFANELIASLSAAHASWREVAEKRLLRAKVKAEKALARERTSWHWHQKLFLRRAAYVWRRRERRRLADARAQWAISHRRAIDTCNQRWQTKFNRLKIRARRLSNYSRTWEDGWNRVRFRLVSLASSYPSVEDGPFHQVVSKRPTRPQAGLMAAVLIFLAINFTLSAGPPKTAHQTVPVGSDGQALPDDLIASLPKTRPPANRTEGAGSGKQIPRTQSKRSPEAIRKPTPDDPRPEHRNLAGKNATSTKSAAPLLPSRPSATPVDPNVKQSSEISDTRLTDRKIRERLQENIRNLRMGHAVQ